MKGPATNITPMTMEHPMKVLAVENSKTDREMIGKHFGTDHFTVEYVARLDELPEDAVARFDVLLLDLNLPDSSGMETLEAVLNRYGGGIPVVVLTGEEDYDFGLRAIRRGAAYFFSKDHIEEDRLAHVATQAVRQHEVMAALGTCISRSKAALG